MAPLSALLLLICLVVAAIYYRLALQDHRFPSKAPSWWSVARASFILALLSGAAIGSLDSNPKHASTLASICLGLLVAPALAPPFFVDKQLEPSLVRRWMIIARSMTTAFMQIKLVALAVFLICLLFSPSFWYFVVALIACALLLAKFSAMATFEAGGPSKPIPPTAVRRSLKRVVVSTLSFTLLFSFAPYVVLSQVPVGPESWSGFAGLALGSLLTLLTSSK